MPSEQPVAIFRGDGESTGSDRSVELPPRGNGILQVEYQFSSELRQTGSPDQPDGPNVGELWVPWPVVRIDGERVRACWATWWYVLPAGQHRLEILSPVTASILVDITAGETGAWVYEAALLSEPAQGAEVHAPVREGGQGSGWWEGTHTGTARLDTAASVAEVEATAGRSIRFALGG